MEISPHSQNSDEQKSDQTMQWRLSVVLFISMISARIVKLAFDELFGKDPSITGDRFFILIPIVIIGMAPRVTKISWLRIILESALTTSIAMGVVLALYHLRGR
jgi:hypothetical protein